MVGGETAEVSGKPATFRSLQSRNYRLYFFGQLISMAGTFMQTVAQGWLVLKLTGSSTALGLVISVQCIPICLLGPFAGVIVDRTDRRRLWMLTQSLAGLCAMTLGVVTVTDVVRLWMVFVFAVALGTVTAVDQTTKIALIPDLVDDENLANAVALNSALNQMAKVVGPALAGAVIAAIGIGPCFFLNALSFVGVIGGLLLMRPGEIHRVPPQPRAPRQLRDGFAFVRRTPEVSSLLLMSGVFFGLVWAFEVVLPGIAKFTFHGGPALYGVLMSALGCGAFVGAISSARRQAPSIKVVSVSGAATGIAIIAASLAPNLPLVIILLACTGACGMAFMSTVSALVQLLTPKEVRGRVVALYIVSAYGTRPFGSPIIGWIGQHVGPRASLGAGGLAMLAVALPVRWVVAGRAGSVTPRRRVGAEGDGGTLPTGGDAVDRSGRRDVAEAAKR